MYKKVLLGGIFVGFIGAAGFYFYPHFWQAHPTTIVTVSQLQAGKIATYDGTPDYGAFLAGYLAKENGDLGQATTYYARAFLSDSTNADLCRQTYLLSAFTGDYEALVLSAEALSKNTQEMFSPLVTAANLVKTGQYGQAAEFTKKTTAKVSMSQIMYPIIRAWAFAGQGDEKSAFKALNALKKESLMWFYWYHNALLNNYFNHRDKARIAFENYADSDDGITLTGWLVLRQFYESQNDWNEQNRYYTQYHLLAKNEESFSEVLLNRADDFKIQTPADAIADTYFTVSRLVNEQLKSTETGLLLNAVAVYLSPDSDLFKIWSAEQFEQAKYYAEANKLYEQIKHMTDKIRMKMALNLVMMGKTEQAIPQIEQISMATAEKELKTHSKKLLAELYIDANMIPEAIALYEDIIKERSAGKADKGALAKLYFLKGDAWSRLGDVARAEEDVRMALSYAPNDATMLNYLGYMLLEQGKDIIQGAAFVQRAYQISPEPHIADSVAWGYYLMREYDKALPFAEQAADNLPFSALVQAHLGDIYWALGRKREAQFQYKKASDLKEDLTDALRAELAQKLK